MPKQLLEQLETPALILDEARMDRNIERMRSHLRRLGVSFRPHVKTNKCIDVARRLMEAFKLRDPDAATRAAEAAYGIAEGTL